MRALQVAFAGIQHEPLQHAALLRELFAQGAGASVIPPRARRRGGGGTAGGYELPWHRATFRSRAAARRGNRRNPLNEYMKRHDHLTTAESDTRRSCEARDLPPHSQHESVDPSPGVIANSGSPNAGIPFGESRHFDLREFVAERVLQRFVLDDRPRSRRAAAAVLLRFAQRHKLQIFRLGRTRLYRIDDFFRALACESQVRIDRLVRRAAE